MPDIPDGFGHLISPYEYLAWLIDAGLDWSNSFEAPANGEAAAVIIDYTVPTTNNLLITDLSIAATTSPARFWAYIRDVTADKIRFTKGDTAGLHDTFPQPIPIPKGHRVCVIVYNFETTQQSFYATLNGYLI